MRLILLLCLSLFLAPVAQASEGRIFLRQEEGTKPRIVPVFVEKGGSYRELSGQVPPDVRSGDLVRLSPKSRSASSVRVLESAERLNQRGKRGFMLAFISWPGAPGTEITHSYEDLTPWSIGASEGRWSWDPVTVREVELSKQPPCNELAWSRATSQKLARMGYQLFRDYGALGIVVPPTVSSSCVPTAYSYQGCFLRPRDPLCGLSVYSHSFTQLSTVIHELGHTLGLDHAEAAPCKEGGLSVSLTYTGTCGLKEYGDWYDPMGASRSHSTFNPFYAEDLGWLKGSRLRKLPLEGSTTTYDLDPYGANKGLRSVMVPLPPSRHTSNSSSGQLAMEYKGRAGIDDYLWQRGMSTCSYLTPRGHLFLRHRPGNVGMKVLKLPARSSHLLDMTPDTETICDSGLPPGDSWTDPTGDLKINYVGVIDGKARVSVEVPKAPQTTISFRPIKKKATYSTRLTFTMRSSVDVNEIQGSDFYLKHGRCNNQGNSPGRASYFRTFQIDLGCHPGKVQLGIRKHAFMDNTYRATPSRNLLSPTIRILSRKRR